LAVVHDTPLFEHVPFFAHCPLLPLAVHAVPTEPVVQAPAFWHSTSAPFAGPQAKPT
jgi:hypothetical protein